MKDIIDKLKDDAEYYGGQRGPRGGSEGICEDFNVPASPAGALLLRGDLVPGPERAPCPRVPDR